MPNPPPSCNTWQEYMKRRITIDTSGNRTGDQGENLPPTTGGICRCALEANQGDNRKTYYVLAQVWANIDRWLYTSGRKSRIEEIIQKPLARMPFGFMIHINIFLPDMTRHFQKIFDFFSSNCHL